MSKTAYSFEEAAAEVGYSVRTLKQAVADGRLIAKYENSKGIIRQIDLDEWLDRMPSEPPTR